MGQIEVMPNTKFFNSKPVTIEIEFQFAVHPIFSPLLHWPLSKIRKFYNRFVRLCGDKTYKYISLRTFQELLPEFESAYTKKVFQKFDPSRRRHMNLLRFLTGLVWCSWATKAQKLHFIFKLFDFDLNGTLTIDEMVLIFVNTCKGLATFTDRFRALPKKSQLVIAASKIFKQADVDHSESLSIDEIKAWVETRKPFVNFLDSYEPRTRVLNEPWIFQNFPPISIEEFHRDPLETLGSIEQIARGTCASKIRQASVPRRQWMFSQPEIFLEKEPCYEKWNTRVGLASSR